MALTVATLGGFPASNTAFQRSAGTPAVAATFSYTNGVYTQSGTQYVAGFLDYSGVVPPRIFYANNGTGGGGGLGSIPLPTLVSVTQISANGQSIQELPSTSFETTPATGYAGFTVIMTPAEPSADSGGPAASTNNWWGSPTYGTGAATLTDVPGYTSQSPSVGYPQPQMRFFVSMSTLLILASTQYG
jgi:hypothetical protein